MFSCFMLLHYTQVYVFMHFSHLVLNFPPIERHSFHHAACALSVLATPAITVLAIPIQFQLMHPCAFCWAPSWAKSNAHSHNSLLRLALQCPALYPVQRNITSFVVLQCISVRKMC